MAVRKVESKVGIKQKQRKSLINHEQISKANRMSPDTPSQKPFVNDIQRQESKRCVLIK